MHIEPLESRIAPAVVFAVEADTNKLVAFDSAAPGTLVKDLPIIGLGGGEIVTAIDFDQTTGTLYGIGVTDNGATRTVTGYTINPVTGIATQFGNLALAGVADVGDFGMEFVGGKIRLTNSSDGNHSISASTVGSATSLDDPAKLEAVTGLAFSRTFEGGPGTAYGYNFTTDELVTIGDIGGSPQNIDTGVVKPIARATLGGVNFAANSSQLGFDIAALSGRPEQGWLSLFRTATGTHLYTMDLGTAELTDLGAIGDGTRKFGGLTVQIDAAAPSVSTDGKTATWTDLDGDVVTLKITNGNLIDTNFRMLAGTGSTSVLAKLTLTDAQFTGTNITLTAKPGPSGGDGRVNIGAINADGVDLGAVTIGGDFQRIFAGMSSGPVGVKSLKAASFARFGTTLVPAGEVANSSIKSGFGSIAIAGDFAGDLRISGGAGGSVTIGGDLVGGSATSSGAINVTSGVVIGKVLVKGDVTGGEGFFSGSLAFISKSITIGGSIRGGGGVGSGAINLDGGAGGKLTIGGSVLGGVGPSSGSLSLSGQVSAKIGGSLEGGAGTDSGSITADNATDFLKSLTVGGDVKTNGQRGGISIKRAGTITIKGSVLGTAAVPVLIVASGIAAPTTAAESVAIGKLTIGGDMENARIIAGLQFFNLSAFTPDAALGAIKIGRNFIASSITAGIDPVNGIVGDSDDKFVGGTSGNVAITARIASITIGGQLLGTAGGAADRFGIIAEQIGAITVGRTKLALTAGQDDFLAGFTADVRVRER